MGDSLPKSSFQREEACEVNVPSTRSILPLMKPFLIGNELEYIRQTIERGNTAGDGYFTEACCRILRERFGLHDVLFVSSGTSALDLTAALLDIQPGDEVILPPYTFVATVNAFVRFGAKPVFVDIRSDTLNIDETKIEAAVTPRTRAIVPVHYAGVGCEMDALQEIADRHSLMVIEDAAQGMDAYYKSRPLGTFGDLSIYSFHEAKNITAGQAGAVCVNNPQLVQRAEILRDKGTNRRQFFRGEVPCYEWVDIGVGHALSEINAAFLYAQFEHMEDIAHRRRSQVQLYRQLLEPIASEDRFRFMQIPTHCTSNNHIFYLILTSEKERDALIAYAKSRGVAIAFHYTPLHASPMGNTWGYRRGDFPVTETMSSRLARLPLFHDMTENDQRSVVDLVQDFFAERRA